MWTTGYDWKVIFLVGSSKDETVTGKVYAEASIYKDIMIEDIRESFYNLSQKVMIGLTWAHYKFRYDFILKGDDDVFIHVDGILNLLNIAQKHEGYFGQVVLGQLVERAGRYGLTKEEYGNNKFDPYCSGGGFILSYGAINSIIPLFNWTKPLKIDDAYFGQLIHRAKITATHVKGVYMWNSKCEYHKHFIISHPVKKIKCMEFLQKRSMIDNGKFINDTLKNQKSAFS